MSQVFGFRSYPPRATPFVNPFTGAVIATPVLDLSSVRGPQGYADRSGTGANGAPIGAPSNARGVFDEAIKLGGVRDTLNCGSNAPLDIAGNISVFCWVYEKVPFALSVLLAKTEGVNGWYLGLNGLGRPQIYFYVGGAVVGGGAGTTVASVRWAHVGFTVFGTVARVFADGLEFARGVVTMSDPPGFALYVGSGNAGGNWLNGLVEIPQEWNGALSPEQVYRQYLQAKDVPIYYDTFESYAVTPVAKAAGSMCGPFRVYSGTWNVSADASGQKWVQNATVGDVYKQSTQAYGTWEWDHYAIAGAGGDVQPLFIASVPGPFNIAAQNGYLVQTAFTGAVALYRTSAGVSAALWTTAAGTVAFSTLYRFRVVRRVGGQFAVYIKGGAYPDFTLVAVNAGSNPAVDNNHTTSNYFAFGAHGVAGPKISGLTQLITCERPASFPWEFSTGTYAGVVSGSTVWMRCLTAGVTYLPKDLDWQTCILKLYKGADANTTDVVFTASEIGTANAANQNCYGIRLSANTNRLQLFRCDNGGGVFLAQTADNYVAAGVEYTFKVTRNNATNTFNVYVTGGAYATETLALGPVVDATYTSGNYQCSDLDANDRTTAPQFYLDLR